jgi:hypothetical protein
MTDTLLAALPGPGNDPEPALVAMGAGATSAASVDSGITGGAAAHGHGANRTIG